MGNGEEQLAGEEEEESVGRGPMARDGEDRLGVGQ